jgi:hypothetical protein
VTKVSVVSGNMHMCDSRTKPTRFKRIPLSGPKRENYVYHALPFYPRVIHQIGVSTKKVGLAQAAFIGLNLAAKLVNRTRSERERERERLEQVAWASFGLSSG